MSIDFLQRLCGKYLQVNAFGIKAKINLILLSVNLTSLIYTVEVDLTINVNNGVINYAQTYEITSGLLLNDQPKYVILKVYFLF